MIYVLFVVLSVLMVGDAAAAPPEAGPRPFACDLDEFLGKARGMKPDQRRAMARGFLARMHGEARQERDGREGIEILQYFLARWAALYRQLGEPDLLAAVDDAPAEAGVTEALCGSFYQPVLREPKARAYYAQPSRQDRLRACFAADELQARLEGRNLPAQRPKADGGLELSACETDQVLGELRSKKTTDKARLVERVMTKMVDLEETDWAGTTYFISGIAPLFRNHPDEAVLQGIDAVARRRLTRGVCAIYGAAVGSRRACTLFTRYYRKQPKPPIPAACDDDDIGDCLGK